MTHTKNTTRIAKHAAFAFALLLLAGCESSGLLESYITEQDGGGTTESSTGQDGSSPAGGTTTNDTSGSGTTTSDTPASSSITYGWDSSFTTYRIDPSTVLGNGPTLSFDVTTGYLTVNNMTEYGQVLIPLSATDTQFMSSITKVTLKLSSSASGTKKTAWKISNSLTDSWGDSGANQLAAYYRDYTDDWTSTECSIYFDGASFNSLSSYTNPVAFAFCNNGGGSVASALTGTSFVIESIIFSK